MPTLEPSPLPLKGPDRGNPGLIAGEHTFETA